MPHPDKIKKLQSILKALKKQLSESPAISLAATFRSHKLPGEYSKLLLEMGVIIKIDFGRRGPSSYEWNKTYLPDRNTATAVIAKYNSIRNSERLRREAGEGIETNKDILVHLKDVLGLMAARLSRIEEAMGISIGIK